MGVEFPIASAASAINPLPAVIFLENQVTYPIDINAPAIPPSTPLIPSAIYLVLIKLTPTEDNAFGAFPAERILSPKGVLYNSTYTTKIIRIAT